MASITLQRDVKANLDSIDKVDGQILFTTDKDVNNNIYTDVLREDGSLERIQIGGLLPSQEQTVTDAVKNSAQSEKNAANSAKLSESWAIGGTNSRDGENTNNSKYYSGQSSDSATNAKSWAIGGTNTRNGEDSNNAKYYAEQARSYIQPATENTVGTVKPDNITIKLKSGATLTAQELQTITKTAFEALTEKNPLIGYLVQSALDTTKGRFYYNGRYYGGEPIISKTKNQYEILDEQTQNNGVFLITQENIQSITKAQYDTLDITTQNNNIYIITTPSDGWGEGDGAIVGTLDGITTNFIDYEQQIDTSVQDNNIYVIPIENDIKVITRIQYDLLNTILQNNNTYVITTPSKSWGENNGTLGTLNGETTTFANYERLDTSIQNSNVYVIPTE